MKFVCFVLKTANTSNIKKSMNYDVEIQFHEQGNLAHDSVRLRMDLLLDCTLLPET